MHYNDGGVKHLSTATLSGVQKRELNRLQAVSGILATTHR